LWRKVSTRACYCRKCLLSGVGVKKKSSVNVASKLGCRLTVGSQTVQKFTGSVLLFLKRKRLTVK
jgi:hypothetical protein